MYLCYNHEASSAATASAQQLVGFCCCYEFKAPTYFGAILVYARVSIDISKDTRRKTKIGFCAFRNKFLGKLCLFERETDKERIPNQRMFTRSFFFNISMIQICHTSGGHRSKYVVHINIKKLW